MSLQAQPPHFHRVKVGPGTRRADTTDTGEVCNAGVSQPSEMFDDKVHSRVVIGEDFGDGFEADVACTGYDGGNCCR